ncbi:hypothetical protein ABZ920_13660 [Streptomyces sp. NPDC046831]|uniref:hypothetical protein n=1 Tax=Streptomyces sp. NPDC046831 TaxID=3154805 RepID=UPI0034038B54
MSNFPFLSPADRPVVPATVWLARGRHAGPAAEAVVRRHLEKLKADAVIQDHLEQDRPEPEGAEAAEQVFEARWQVPGDVTVRARLALRPHLGPADAREWVLAAEAEQPWDARWPSPAAVFWPQEPDAGWDLDAAADLRLGDVNRLPEDDDKALRRVLRHAARDTWSIHVVVHEAMTPDERGRRSLVRMLPPGLRHRVVEHRAAPHRLRAVNWALEESAVELPRGGAVVLPGSPKPSGYDAREFSVRTVFLDGTEPTELIDAVTRFDALPRTLPEGAAAALTALREDWHLVTVEEELARARALVAMYAEALEAMTKSRDLYREAAERAHEALAAYRDSEGALPAPKPSRTPAESPLRQLTRGLGRLKETALALRPAAPGSGPDGGTGPLPLAGADPSADAGADPVPGAGPGSLPQSRTGSDDRSSPTAGPVTGRPSD